MILRVAMYHHPGAFRSHNGLKPQILMILRVAMYHHPGPFEAIEPSNLGLFQDRSDSDSFLFELNLIKCHYSSVLRSTLRERDKIRKGSGEFAGTNSAAASGSGLHTGIDGNGESGGLI